MESNENLDYEALLKAYERVSNQVNELHERLHCPFCGCSELLCGHESEKGCCIKDEQK